MGERAVCWGLVIAVEAYLNGWRGCIWTVRLMTQMGVVRREVGVIELLMHDFDERRSFGIDDFK